MGRSNGKIGPSCWQREMAYER